MKLLKPPLPLIICSTLLCCLLAIPENARAGGLFISGHGVRALGRGGAFTAGGDDPSGLWHNPANLGQVEGLQVLLDASLVFSTLEYQRVDSGGNLLPAVNNESPLVPIPTLSIAGRFWGDRLALGFSISAPYAPISAFPRPNYGPCADPNKPSNCIDTAAQDAPQRYSLISMEDSLFLQLDLAVAWNIIPQITVGASLQNHFINFVTLSSLSAYNGISSGPEDPEFDSLAQLHLSDMLNISGKFGVLIRPIQSILIGVSFQLPVWAGGEAESHVQLPVSPLFTKSYVEGSAAEVDLTIPMALHAGVELRMIPLLRLEVGFDWEQWSVFEKLEIRPKDIYIYNIPNIDKYKIPTMEVQLMLKDTFAVRVGGELTVPGIPLSWLKIMVRAGYFFETGAVQDEYAAVLANDPNKHALTLGLGLIIKSFRLDVAYAHIFLDSRVVHFNESRSKQVNPLNPTGAVAVGGGSYRGFTDIVGLGLNWTY